MPISASVLNKWLASQSTGVIVALIFSFGFWELLHERDVSHKETLRETHKRYADRIERMRSHLDAYTKAYTSTNMVIRDIDNRMGQLSGEMKRAIYDCSRTPGSWIPKAGVKYDSYETQGP